MKAVKGKVHKYGDDINTDVIIPSRYYWTSLVSEEGKEMARKYAMADLDPDFVKKAKEGDVVVAGNNFGCGSSRENAATVFVHLGISAVVAKSFAHIFYRNAINNGLTVVVAPEAVDKIESGDTIEIDFNKCKIKNDSKGFEIEFPRIPELVTDILENGGLVDYTLKKMGKT